MIFRPSCRWVRSWPFAQIDSQLIALFFEKLFLDDELADLALEDRWHVVFKVLFPSADLGGGDVVLLGDLLNGFLALERLGGDTGFDLGGEVPSLSFIGLIPEGFKPVRPAGVSTECRLRFPRPLHESSCAKGQVWGAGWSRRCETSRKGTRLALPACPLTTAAVDGTRTLHHRLHDFRGACSIYGRFKVTPLSN